jgi:hypothetical protein
MIYQDRKKLLQKSQYDYSGPEINKYLDLITAEIKKTKRVAYEEIKKLINQAVAFNASFVIRPNWTLTRLIFTEEEKRHVEEFKLLVNYCYYYDFLKKILLTYFDKKNIFSITSAEFETILGKIDNQLSSEDLNSYLDHAIYSISDFYNIGGSANGKIPVRTMEIFLKEKNLVDHLVKIKREFSKESKQKVSVEELKNNLLSGDSLKPGHELSPVHPDEVSSVLEKERFDEEITAPESNNDIIVNAGENEAPAENEYSFEEKEEPPAPDFEQLKKELSDNMDLNGLNEISNQENMEITEQLDTEPENKAVKNEPENSASSAEISSINKNNKEIKRDIFSFLSDKEIEKIVESVFNEDRDDFTNTMERISECGTYEEAAEIIKGLFQTYKVNPYSRDAILLTDAVSNYFEQS